MIDYSFLSLNGSYQINEDKIGILDLPNRKCFILCDGLGGHGKGEVASGIAVDYAKYFFTNCKYVNKHTINDCFVGAHQQIKNYQEQHNDLQSAKTTMVMLIIENGIAYWAHVGDSRLYWFNRLFLKERTKDHSVTQMMVEMGEIKESEIRRNPDRNKLLRALGMDDTPKIEIHSPVIQAKNGYGFLLCSDGFWDWITENDMTNYYRFSADSQGWLKRMRKTVEQNGRFSKMDNYSAIAIKI